ncbi:MAG: tryptophan 7-halogenase [Blastocatellia bacterium]|nr:tryptophan 7-halogenase [Blastocatellia bacterium]
MKTDFDLAIVGSGFSGALLAMIARRIGLSVILLERSAHPRFAIGESTSPLMNLILEQLAERYDLPRLKPLTTWGEWQRTYPEVIGGLKRGFTYFKHEVGTRYRTAENRANQLLVAASPNDETADTHWLRSSVDHFLLNEAVALGAEYLDHANLTSLEWLPNGSAKLIGNRREQPVRVSAKFVVDASGPSGFLSRQLDLPETKFAGYPATQSLFSHFINVPRCDQMPDYQVAERPPYPMDDAALHHVFDSGWMWVLRFNNGVTSAGIAVTDQLANELKLSEGVAAWRRFLARFPSIAAQFAEAEAIREFTWMPRLAYRATQVAGNDWALLPSAAAFVDPLFSTGMPLALLGVERLGCLLAESFGRTDFQQRLQAYNDITLAEADHTAQFIAGCYAAFPQFELFTNYSMFYFAAASFSEMARRLQQSHLVRRFLAADHPTFAAAKLSLGRALREGSVPDPEKFAAEVQSQTDCLNIAGLCDDTKSNWYDVDFADIIRASNKLEMTAEEMRATLQQAAWARP